MPPHLRPQTDYSCRRKYGANNPCWQRVFFEFSDEHASQPGGGGGGDGGAASAAQLAFLQGQLRDKDRRIQDTCTRLVEAEERAERAEGDLAATRTA